MKKSKLKLEVVDVNVKAQRSKGRGQIKSFNEVRGGHAERFRQLDAIPEEAAKDPVGYAERHMESLIPHAAKELEWQLKFGDAKTRKEISLEMLAFKGISNRGPNTGQVVPAIQLIMNGAIPWSQSLPPSNNPPTLVEGEVIKEGKKDGIQE